MLGLASEPPEEYRSPFVERMEVVKVLPSCLHLSACSLVCEWLQISLKWISNYREVMQISK